MTPDLRLAPAAVAVYAAAVVTLGDPGVGLPIVVLGWLLALGSLVGILRRGRRPGDRARRRRTLGALLSVSMAGASLAAASALVADAAAHPAELDGLAESRAVAQVEVTVRTAPRIRAATEQRSRSMWFEGAVEAVGATDSARVPLPHPVAVTVMSDHVADAATEVRPGARILITTRVIRAGGDRAVAYTLRTLDPWERLAPPPALDAFFDGIRTAFAAEAGLIPGDAGGLLPGLAIGDTSRLDPSLEEDMLVAALSHLTAVSGANCAIVIAAALLLAALVGAGRILRTAVALVVLAGFVALVLPEPSVVRASCMATIVLLVRALGRPGSASAALLLAVIVLVVQDPTITLRIGFLLSALATAGLLLLGPPLVRALSTILPTPIAVVLAIPLAAQLACQPAVILIEPSIPLYGVLANLAAEPAAPFVTVLGLLGALLLPIVPPLATLIIAVAAAPAWWIASVARTVVTFPSPTLPWMPGPVGAIVLTVLSAAAVGCLLTRHASRGVRLVACGCVALLAIVIPAYLTGVVADPLLRRAATPAGDGITMCDVGQGDAIVLRNGEETMMIDVGPDADAAARCLEEIGVQAIDLLVLTHYDLDHVGGIDGVLPLVRSALVGPPDRPGDDRLLARLSDAGVEVRVGDDTVSGALDGAPWRLVWPPAGSTLRSNAASLVVVIDLPGFRAILLGDTGEGEQLRILRSAGSALDGIDVVKVAHHGSRDQSHAFYEKVDARLALVPVGARNSFGHPSSDILDLLSDRGAVIARSDLHGRATVSVLPDGGLSLHTERVGSNPTDEG